MVILNSLVSIVVVVSLGLNAYRFMIDYRIRQVENDTNLTTTTRRKLYRIKQKEQERHIYILLINGLLVGFIVI
ncbi:MAG: hypothetical protein L0M06_14400 [Enterococcus sp.]|uniref:hypothetical protein n=1 Tax=Enterococcus sp. TaxID=35783 RepID=UPI002648E84C|nr:hypothetical protein [Enterococcus sp.]MDN6003127.1 hypothetical protein [Enterococcus sp.]MDN6518085.1 hypothetical protein [Enterococcus sp.]MDN6561347.1 hypothetical protein [Enterococcus sp.]MDN6777739.1 hypothetical protein [Enterococcus sp.]